MELAAFKDLAAGVQSLAIAGAVFAGGAWALYRYASLRERDKAEKELENMTKSLNEQAVIEMSLHPEQHFLAGDERYFISIKARIANKGNRNTAVFFPAEGCMFIAPITYDADSRPQVADKTNVELLHGGPAPITASMIFSGLTSTKTFLAVVDRPGLYLLTFRVLANPTEEAVARQDARLDESLTAVWSESQVIQVVPNAADSAGSN